SVAVSLVTARIIALLFNYAVVRHAVFLSDATHRVVFPRYLMLATANVCLSYTLISLAHGMFAAPVMPTKILVESVLFIANFAIQRDFVFARHATDIPSA
ncbi:MAG TPA: GtrA family protein, partial [Bryobacteraceae bacterium]|nr:GtrA family protein [Bryobacteraceae bacterium]